MLTGQGGWLSLILFSNNPNALARLNLYLRFVFIALFKIFPNINALTNSDR
jgi:hypothetical protein